MDQVQQPISQRSVLFVCLGNTCRSPMAEAVLKHLLKKEGVDLLVESAGTRDYHVGKNPNPKTMKVLEENGIKNFIHKARQIEEDDFHQFTWIICMDKWNLKDLEYMKPAKSRARLHRLGEFVENMDVEDVYDPYFDGNDASFYSVYDHIFNACNGLVKKIIRKDVTLY